jgi:hypothetical protein
LKDGERGFAAAAEKLRDSDRAQWATTLDRLSEQRAGFRREIVEMGHEYGEDVDESGSVAASVHRGWISLKDALTGDDPGGVLTAALTGEVSRRVRIWEGAPAGSQSWIPRVCQPTAHRATRRARRGQGASGLLTFPLVCGYWMPAENPRPRWASSRGSPKLVCAQGGTEAYLSHEGPGLHSRRGPRGS